MLGKRREWGEKSRLRPTLNDDMQLPFQSENVCIGASKGLKQASATSLKNRPTLECSNYSLILQIQYLYKNNNTSQTAQRPHLYIE